MVEGFGFSFVTMPLLGTIFTALIGAFVVQLATRWTCDFKPSYGKAFVSCLLAYFASMLVIIVISSLFMHTSMIATPLMLPAIAFLTGSYVYGKMLKRPNGDSIGFGKGVLVSLMSAVIGAVLSILFTFLFGIIMAGSSSTMMTM